MAVPLAALLRLTASVVVPVAILSGQEPQRSPTFRTEANHIRVEVFATSRGMPVTDLRKSDFELLEDGHRQEIEEFEHVAIAARRTTAPEASAVPVKTAESVAVAENPRARVVVVFLDTNHVDLSGSHRIREPLVAALEQLAGPGDVFGLMTPSRPVQELTLTARPADLTNELARAWDWGRRDNPGGKDSTERDCEATRPLDPGRAEALIARRREQQTLKALADVTDHLRNVRDGRKAILLVTDGWKSYPPGEPWGCGVDPSLDGAHALRSVIGAANRANVSFYPLDPRGLPVFDQSIARPLTPGAGTPLSGFLLAKRPDLDAELFRARRETLQTLADGTDGLAALDSNDLPASLTKIFEDLGAYYLLGYYSTGKLDGKFHATTVRVKRPGVRVRARRGYLATMESPPPASGNADARSARLAEVIAPLAGYARELPLRVHVATGWQPGEAALAAAWVHGELGGGRQPAAAGTTDALATIQLLTPEGRTLATSRVPLRPTTRTFRAALSPSAPLAPGAYIVRVSVASSDQSGTTRETLPITVAPRPQASGALWMRRSAATRHRDVPTTDLRFRRSERISVEIPTPTAGAAVARLLDRSDQPMSIPVDSAIRTDPDGSQWLSASLSLAPLAEADYVIELSGPDGKVVVAFAVVP